jgi:hypothetical protein
MTNPSIPPAWSLTIPPPPTDGVVPPVGPINVGLGLTEPDANGHQWLVAQYSDGNIDVSMRMPWQVAAQVFGQLAQAAAQLATRAALAAGPSLVIPPAGIDLSIFKNGGKANGPG